MKILFKKIVMSNFLSFGDAEVALCDRGYVLVRGINNNPVDNAQSNGSGKTTIFNAISWCLTGQTLSGVKSNIVNINGSDGCFVGLEFDIDSSHYIVRRSKDHSEFKTNLSIWVDGRDISGKGIRESEKILEQYIPELTFQLLSSVILLGQGLPERFTNNTPSGRKEVLERLSKSDFMIDDIKTKLSNRKQKLQSDLRETEDNLLSDNTTLNLKTRYKMDSESELIQLDSTELSDEIKNLDNQYKSIQDRIDDITIQINVQGDSEYEIDSDIESLEITHNNDLKDLDEQYASNTRDLELSLNEVSLSLGVKTSELARINSIREVCPTCGQRIPGATKPNTSVLEADIHSLSELCSGKRAELEAIRRVHNNKLRDLNAIYSNSMQALKNSLRVSKTRSDDLQRKFNQLVSERTEVLKKKCSVQSKLEAIDLSRNKLKDTIKVLAAELEELQSSILYNNTKKEELTQRLSIVNKMLTIATRDFRGFLLTNVIDYIDSRAKEYCNEIFGTNLLNFYLDGNNLDISYDNKLYESLSTGEKQKVDIIVQLSLRDMLCKYMDFNCNILALDEVFDGLDSVGCEKIVNLINNLSDIDSVFIITHHTNDIELSYDSEITVVKDKKGISRIV